MPKHLVLGVNGQDGSYLAENLLARGVNVVGVGRQANSLWVRAHPNYSYQQLNLEDIQGYIRYLELARPDYLYHLAAIHGPAGFDYKAKWIEAHTINTLVVQASLEHFRTENLRGKFIYASSSKVFDFNANNVISESTPRESRCIYSITKNSATELIYFYRKNFDIESCVFWLFNHESERRKESYFIPKVVDVLKNSLVDNKYKAKLGDLNFWGDWGDASEYMEIICDIVEKNVNDDFVLGSGQVINAAEYVNNFFLSYGVNPAQAIADWKEFKHGESSPPWKLDLSKLKYIAGRVPQKDIYEISSQILKQRCSKKHKKL